MFHFDEKNFLQTKGTAMGTKMAPTYANLVLAYLEEIMYDELQSEKGSDCTFYSKQQPVFVISKQQSCMEWSLAIFCCVVV